MTRVFCKESQNRGLNSRLDFYLETKTENHYLFSQTFSNELYNLFKGGMSLDKALDCSQANRNKSILKVIDKLPSHIRYIEQEYGLTILRKTMKRVA